MVQSEMRRSCWPDVHLLYHPLMREVFRDCSDRCANADEIGHIPRAF